MGVILEWVAQQRPAGGPGPEREPMPGTAEMEMWAIGDHAVLLDWRKGSVSVLRYLDRFSRQVINFQVRLTQDKNWGPAENFLGGVYKAKPGSVGLEAEKLEEEREAVGTFSVGTPALEGFTCARDSYSYRVMTQLAEENSELVARYSLEDPREPQALWFFEIRQREKEAQRIKTLVFEPHRRRLQELDLEEEEGLARISLLKDSFSEASNESQGMTAFELQDRERFVDQILRIAEGEEQLDFEAILENEMAGVISLLRSKKDGEVLGRLSPYEGRMVFFKNENSWGK